MEYRHSSTLPERTRARDVQLTDGARTMNVLDGSHPVDDQLSIFDSTYHDARDVVCFAESAPLLIGEQNCASWHLDRDGRFACGTNGTSRDSLESWARDPERLVRSFLEFRTKGTCTPNWIVVEERAANRSGEPGEADVEHFMRLRYQLEVVGITLMDAVVFDGGERWWSMCELLTGSTHWGTHAFPDIAVERLRPIA